MTEIANETVSYQSLVQFSEPPEKVFDALTSLAGLDGWWSPVTGSGTAGGELRLNHRHPEPLVIHVDVAEGPRSVAWTVLDYPLNPEWAGTRITFELSPGQGGGTTLQFLHLGLTADLECYDHCARGWEHFLPSLRDYVETGTGSPLAAAD